MLKDARSTIETWHAFLDDGAELVVRIKTQSPR
jgi:hypothetical protein